MASLDRIISLFPTLQSLASFVSTQDLFNLALTCKSNYLYILSSQRTFNALRRHCLCDGHGLVERQTFTGLYSLDHLEHLSCTRYNSWTDEPIEVRLYNTKCDATEALPCRKCGINICEECRYYQREPPDLPEPRPHVNAAWESRNVMCLCNACDARLEGELQGQFLNELCDCDVFTRWICHKCVKEEQQFTQEYYDDHTEIEEGGGITKYILDSQFYRDVSGNLAVKKLQISESLIAISFTAFVVEMFRGLCDPDVRGASEDICLRMSGLSSGKRFSPTRISDRSPPQGGVNSRRLQSEKKISGARGVIYVQCYYIILCSYMLSTECYRTYDSTSCSATASSD